MIPYIRKEKILSFFANREVVYIQELADELDISLSTIRRDLMDLENDGEITQLRGGAAKLSRKDLDIPVSRKKQVNREAKEHIAQKAAALVEDSDVIYIDSGTTTMAMLPHIKAKRITIVTSSTQAAPAIPADATCIFLGGELLLGLESVVGTITEKLLSDMFFDKAFIGANGYERSGGVYTFDVREARKKEMITENSGKTYLLADSSKENKKAFCRVANFSDFILISELEEPAEDTNR